MEWSEEEYEQLMEAQGREASAAERRASLEAVASKAVELVAARGGTMTAEDLTEALQECGKGCRFIPDLDGQQAFSEYINSVGQHVAAQGARVAVLEVEKANLEEGSRLLNERRLAAEEGNRDLVRRAQQAESRVEVLETSLRGSEARGKMILGAKNDWAERARAAEARCATLSAAGQVLGEHVDKSCSADLHGPPEMFSGARLGRYPCSPTCTHDDAKIPGHPERVKGRSEAVCRIVPPNAPWVSSTMDPGAAYERGAEAMRAACWEAVQAVLERHGWKESGLSVDIKAAIERAAP
jgi:hypothetical protein